MAACLANRCVMCMSEEESSKHLFLDCRVSIGVWNWATQSARYPTLGYGCVAMYLRSGCVTT
ncbi:hypothetical protein FRX31_014849 [Thalictrum thalictroides]|uniref:Reverse transcriptase zinc-binding domain-containing protein n=1 Tax=Thalictrum thalictroides TaxID=46969 RepID=A0A7J6WGM1_THATH|nr:hypothetical protein FRX31_014849 [Thalictrum thalictroides]